MKLAISVVVVAAVATAALAATYNKGDKLLPIDRALFDRGHFMGDALNDKAFIEQIHNLLSVADSMRGKQREELSEYVMSFYRIQEQEAMIAAMDEVHKQRSAVGTSLILLQM